MTNTPLPVSGYTEQPDNNVALVNEHKAAEERILRHLDTLTGPNEYVIDQRWLAIARTHIEQGFMALNRSVFKPRRVKLDGDE